MTAPGGVRLGRGDMSALSPFYPQFRTLVSAAGTAAPCPSGHRAASLDHLVGATKQGKRES
jgi:hypothetical protein